ncbi:MAG TPA: DUF2723 domain-containing protein [Melioribacteraceae bacterium]|nr:DUF2723 domain-containing protein [Melioribacteraceae bacterium]
MKIVSYLKNIPSKYLRIETVTAFIIPFFVLIIYMITLAHGVIQIDSGELAAVQATLGIAHPTGYPLFTLAGYIFLQLPLPFSSIYQLNLLAAIWCALGIFFLFKSVLLLLQNINIDSIQIKNKTGNKKSLTDADGESKKISYLSAAGGMVFLAFSRTFWMQSTSVEVYSLQIFIFSLIFYFSLRSSESKRSTLFQWVGTGIALALGFTNHMTTILIVPFTAILYFSRERFGSSSLKKILITATVSFLVLFLLYLYLPIRSSLNPEINWGNPVNFENFFRHVTGKQYQVWLFSSFDSAIKQLKYFAENLPGEFTWPGLIIGLFGLFSIYRSNIRIFWLLFISFVSALLYAINYDIADIDSYFLFNYILIAILITLGLYRLQYLLISKYNSMKRAIIFLPLISLFPLLINFSKVDQSDQHTFDDYTKSILNSVEKDAIIFSYQWDYFISASYYYQFVEKIREDVIIVDKELLRRSWYFNQLKRNKPDLFDGMEEDISQFLKVLQPFEDGDVFDPNLLEMNYRNVMKRLVETNEGRDFYIGLELFSNEMQRGEFSLPGGYNLVPHIFLFKATKSNEYIDAPDADFILRFPPNKNRYNVFIEETVGRMLSYRILYEISWDRKNKAIGYYKKIREGLPGFQIPPQVMERIQQIEN